MIWYNCSVKIVFGLNSMSGWVRCHMDLLEGYETTPKQHHLFGILQTKDTKIMDRSPVRCNNISLILPVIFGLVNVEQ